MGILDRIALGLIAASSKARPSQAGITSSRTTLVRQLKRHKPRK